MTTTVVRAVLASQNAHKLAELRAALPAWVIEPLPRDDFPPETGMTYAENARAKARFGRLHAPEGSWVIAEDSGIEARALDGRPGVESARWAADGVSRLQRELSGVTDRRARYVCELVAVDPYGREVATRGTLNGHIVEGPPRGSAGFGYDPIFVPDGAIQTVAELGDEWKRSHSHRARAVAAFVARVAG